MTVYYCDKQLIPFTLQVKPTGLRSVCCPEPKYETASPQKNLQDTLEDHLAMYHYHQTALLELARSEYAPDANEWEYGAYLTGLKLQEQSEWLLQQLSQGKTPEL